MISPSDSASFDLQPVSFNPANSQGFGALIYIPIMLVVCVIFSSLALGLNWLNLDAEYDFVDSNEDDLKIEIEDSLSERENYAKMGTESARETQSNDDLEDEGYEDTVSQKVTLKVITIIMIIFTGIAVLLSLAAFTNYFPVVKIMTMIVWIVAVLSIAQIVIFVGFYDPYAGSAEDEDDSDSDIECEDEEESGFAPIYAEATGDCVIYGEKAEASATMYAGAAFWFAAVQMILVIVAAIMSTTYTRNLGSRGSPNLQVFQTY
tara:strand:- start:129 stop:917 length:789 start_codon:yes stop_codon:yes gene_type:complete